MTTATLIADVEARLTAQVSGIDVGQWYDGMGAAPSSRQHKGATVLLPIEVSADEDYSTRDSSLWADHEIEVQYAVQLGVNGDDALTTRTAALTLGDGIREALVGPHTWARSRHARFLSHALTKSGGLLVGTFAFAFRIPISVGS